EILSFNAHQLRMIASSRKKTDRRDAYWIARALQTGMHPHRVYLPTGEIRELRALLTRRRNDPDRPQPLAVPGAVRPASLGLPGAHRRPLSANGPGSAPGLAAGVDGHLGDLLELCQRQERALSLELGRVEAGLRERARSVEAIGRLQTLPGIGALTATTIWAWGGRATLPGREVPGRVRGPRALGPAEGRRAALGLDHENR